MLMFNSLIDGEWLSDGARAPNVNPSDTKDIVGQAVRGTRAQAEAASHPACPPPITITSKLVVITFRYKSA